MRHFETRKQAQEFIDNHHPHCSTTKIFKKIKGMRNRHKKPFLVGSEFEWLNQY